MSNADLMNWMLKRGLNTDLEITDIQSMGKGLISTKEFTQGNVFLRIPRDLIITIETVQKQLGNFMITEIQALVLFLAAMKSERFYSEWTDYLNAIPENIILPMFMDPEILECASQHVKDHVKKQLHAFDNDITALLDLGMGLETHLLKWAWLAVNTRCVTLRSRKDGFPTIALMPFLDFLNHSSSVTVDSFFDSRTGCFELSCHDTILKESQAFLCYGPHDNTFLACEYGFVEENNIYDYVMIQTHMVYSSLSKSLARFSLDFRDILLQSHVIQEFVFQFEQVSYSLLMTIRLAVYISDWNNETPDLDLSIWDELVQGERDIISIENELKVNQIVVDICNRVKQEVERRLKSLEELRLKDCPTDKEQSLILKALAMQELRILNSIMNLP